MRMIAEGKTGAIFERSVDKSRYSAVWHLLIAALILLADVCALMLMQHGEEFLNLLYECVSAMGTVGISAMASANLASFFHILIILMMRLKELGVKYIIAKDFGEFHGRMFEKLGLIKFCFSSVLWKNLLRIIWYRETLSMIRSFRLIFLWLKSERNRSGLKRRSMNLICAAEKVLRSCRLYGRKAEYYAVDGYRTP